MKKMYKIAIVYSIIFWLLVAIGLILMGLAFQKVPIGQYGLRIDYFSPSVDNQYYTNGLYHKGIGYYFVLYPRTKQFVLNQKLTVINKDLQKLEITYTLSYRINPLKIYDMYYAVALDYNSRLVSLVNNIVSSQFSILSQSDSRVSAQQAITAAYNAVGKINVDNIFKGGIIVEGIWVNYIDFLNSESYYQTAYIYSSSSSPSYQAAAYNLSIAKLQINGLNSALQSTKQAFIKTMQLSQQSQYNSLIKTSSNTQDQNIAKISSIYNTSRVLNYYKKSQFVFY